MEAGEAAGAGARHCRMSRLASGWGWTLQTGSAGDGTGSGGGGWASG